MRAALEAAAGTDARIDFFTDPLSAPWVGFPITRYS